MNNDSDTTRGQDHADATWEEGVCLTCGEPNDRRDQNLHICSDCEKKK